MTKEELKQYQHEYWKKYKQKYGERIRAKQREFYNTSYHNNPEFKEKRIRIFKKWRYGNAGKIWWEQTREWRNTKSKKFRQTPKGKLISILTAQRMKKKYPEKWNARLILRQAVRYKKIKKSPCEICGNKYSQGHHEDYSKPLEVIWFCDKHHKEHHKSLI